MLCISLRVVTCKFHMHKSHSQCTEICRENIRSSKAVKSTVTTNGEFNGYHTITHRRFKAVHYWRELRAVQCVSSVLCAIIKYSVSKWQNSICSTCHHTIFHWLTEYMMYSLQRHVLPSTFSKLFNLWIVEITIFWSSIFWIFDMYNTAQDVNYFLQIKWLCQMTLTIIKGVESQIGKIGTGQ